jgi:pimeloyl-ACP methyl ester carboxylesterase
VWHDFAIRRNIRVISIDRPGMGLSTYVPDRKILDWPTDVVRLADHLGVGKKFTVLGSSGGGSYALACAYAIPERMQGVGVMAGLGPWQGFKTTERMPWGRRINWFFAKYGGEAAVKS